MIGVFDSGSGGLTILEKLQERMPQHDFVYLGDHLNAPYGTRTARDIYRRCCRNIAILMERGCSLVILACNTASVTMLRRIQQVWLPRHFPGRRVIGVFVPLVEYMTGQDWLGRGAMHQGLSGNVTLFATPFTVKSGMFSQEIYKRSRSLQVNEKACPALVKAIEDQACSEVIDALVESYVRQCGLTDRLSVPGFAVLGCTHFPLVERSFLRALPEGCQMISQPDVVASSLADYLIRHPDLAEEGGADRYVEHFTTGDARTVSRTVSRFLGREIGFQPL